MMKTVQYSLNTQTDALTLYLDFFNPTTIGRDHPRYAEILSVVNAGGDNLTKVETLLKQTAKIEKKVDWSAQKLKEEGAEIKDGKLYIDGREQTGRIVVLATEYARKTGSIAPIKRFLERLDKNPSEKSKQEGWDFLQHCGLPIMPDGMVRGYKGIHSDGWSKTGNKQTRVLQGKVNEKGCIYNGIGETIEVFRGDVDDDRTNYCSKGLHVGTYEYASGFGVRVVLVEFDPADIVSVPTDCNCQKLRCSKYKVLEAYTNNAPIPDTVPSYTKDEILEEIDEVLFVDDIPEYALTGKAKLISHIRNACDLAFDELTDADFNSAIKEFDSDINDLLEEHANNNKVNSYVTDVESRVKNYVNKKKRTTIGAIQKALNPTKVGCSELDGLVKKLGFKVKTNDRGISNWQVIA